MTRSELINLVSAEFSLMEKRKVYHAVISFFESISKTLQTGGKVELRGLGSFYLKKRQARKGVHPKSGALLDIPPRIVPLFRAGKMLKIQTNREEKKIKQKTFF